MYQYNVCPADTLTAVMRAGSKVAATLFDCPRICNAPGLPAPPGCSTGAPLPLCERSSCGSIRRGDPRGGSILPDSSQKCLCARIIAKTDCCTTRLNFLTCVCSQERRSHFVPIFRYFSFLLQNRAKRVLLYIQQQYNSYVSYRRIIQHNNQNTHDNTCNSVYVSI